MGEQILCLMGLSRYLAPTPCVQLPSDVPKPWVLDIYCILYGNSHSVSKLLLMRLCILKVWLAMKTISKAKKEEGALRKLVGVCVCDQFTGGSKVRRYTVKWS